jgi:hypothetical protein
LAEEAGDIEPRRVIIGKRLLLQALVEEGRSSCLPSSHLPRGHFTDILECRVSLALEVWNWRQRGVFFVLTLKNAVSILSFS